MTKPTTGPINQAGALLRRHMLRDWMKEMAMTQSIPKGALENCHTKPAKLIVDGVELECTISSFEVNSYRRPPIPDGVGGWIIPKGEALYEGRFSVVATFTIDGTEPLTMTRESLKEAAELHIKNALAKYISGPLPIERHHHVRMLRVFESVAVSALNDFRRTLSGDPYGINGWTTWVQLKFSEFDPARVDMKIGITT